MIITFLIDSGILKLKILIIDGTPCQSKCNKPKEDKIKKISDPEAAFGCTNWGKNWFFGYKSVILASSEPLIVPLAWQAISANQQEAQYLIPVVSKASWLLEENNRYELAGDSSLDSAANFNWCSQLNIRFTCPLNKSNNLKGKRLKREKFYQSKLGQKLYQRREDIERLNNHLKDIFLIDPFPVKGLRNVNTYLNLVMLLYLAGIYYNHTSGRKLKEIKSLIA